MGYAWRMSELHAAVGLVHLSHLDEAIATRRRVAARYDEALSDAPVPTPSHPAWLRLQLLQVRDAPRSGYRPFGAQAGSGRASRGVAFGRGVHASAASPADLCRVGRGSFPVADDVCARHICLPVHSDMTDDEADYVVESLTAALQGWTMAKAATT